MLFLIQNQYGRDRRDCRDRRDGRALNQPAPGPLGDPNRPLFAPKRPGRRLVDAARKGARGKAKGKGKGNANGDSADASDAAVTDTWSV
ncbi:hypothetical protein JYU34_022385 [Plutella xylostella]|uniref:Uncharacterized protein n=1 Tax=Plutella xylostella TaxID=51655 RepID=A0ABQ7PRC2_PLUXY|nr:hypothetical protein JYU34_022385 [Plutella xylostella]